MGIETRISGLRCRLLASVSVAALMLGTAIVEAQEPGNNFDIWGIAEIHAPFVAGSVGDVNNISGIGNLDPKYGFNGTLGVGFRPVGSAYDFALLVTYGETKRQRDSGTYITTVYVNRPEAKHTENHFIVDFEAGRDVGLGSANDARVRVKGGVRIARFRAKTDQSSYNTFGATAYSATTRSTFTGAGPRIGFDAEVPFQGVFSLDFGGAGAVLYGKRKLRVNGNLGPLGICCNSDSKNTFVPNVDGYAGVSFHLPDAKGKFTVGYKMDAWFGVHDFGSNKNRIYHGPFMRLTFGGG